MAVVLEKKDLRSYEIKQKEHKKKVAIIAVSSVIALIIVAVSIVLMMLNRNYNGYEVIKSIDRKDTSSATYYPYKNGVLRLSRDGIMAMDGSGAQLFNGMFQMKDPVIDTSDSYVVIYDRGSKGLEIINNSGKMTSVNNNRPIIKAEVANQGVVAVLTDGGDENYLSYYTADGELLLETRTLAAEDGYPVDIALSDDAKRLVTSYVALNNGNMQSKVTFQNFTDLGKNYDSNIVGAKDIGQTLIGDVEFINNTTIGVFGDDRFILYSMEKVPEIIHNEAITKEIKSIFYSKEYIGLALLNNGGESKYELVVYDLKGNKILDKKTNIEYSSILISGNEIIMYSSTEWNIWGINGKQKLNYTFNDEIMNILPGKGLNKYIIVKSDKIEDVKLTEK